MGKVKSTIEYDEYDDTIAEYHCIDEPLDERSADESDKSKRAVCASSTVKR